MLRSSCLGQRQAYSGATLASCWLSSAARANLRAAANLSCDHICFGLKLRLARVQESWDCAHCRADGVMSRVQIAVATELRAAVVKHKYARRSDARGALSQAAKPRVHNKRSLPPCQTLLASSGSGFCADRH